MNEFTITQAKVGKAIEVNGKVGVLSVAVKREYKNDDGTYTSDWFKVKVFGKTIDVMQRFVGVGDTLNLKCRIQNNNWQDKDGIKHYENDIILEKFEFVAKAQPKQNQERPIQNQEPVDDSEDLPF